MRKGTSEEGTELCMYGARGRGEGGSERMREGATERGRGAFKGGPRRKGDREGGKLKGRYLGGHWPICYIQCTKLYTTRPLPLRLWYPRVYVCL